jgi:carbohydrate kinase (thermoresistant glucokinase family)
MISMPIVVMGVSGSGKTTVGRLLAQRLEMPFVDGDDLHSLANKKKMADGIPLQDADRLSWLYAIAEVLAGRPTVLACSALKRRYRDILRDAAPNLRLVYLSGSKTLLAQRLAARSHEFMPPRMLESQLQTLEPPQAEEKALTLNIESPPGEIAKSVASWIDKSSLSAF